MRIVRETRRPVAEIARELGIGAGTLGNWGPQGPRRARRGGGPDRGRPRRAGPAAAPLRRAGDGARCPQTIGGPLGQGGDDAMSTASFIASQRTDHGVRARCRVGRWGCRTRRSTPGSTTPRRRRGGAGPRSTPRSPPASTPPAGPMGRRGCWRICAPPAGGCRRKTVEASMARQGLQGPQPPPPPGLDPPRPRRPGRSGLVGPRFQRRMGRPEMGRGLQTDQHPRGARVSGDRGGPVLAAAARLRAV